MRNEVYENLKLVFICFIVFFGASFAIMTFNEDVSVKDLFEKINMFVGESDVGLKTIQLTYGLGMAIGITAFYNHFGRKRKENEPTPIELKMKQYEDDIKEYMMSDKQK
ncbi:MAG: hypothetical protein IJA34_08300 [Lachnospiraceae bacterium]|nr:hypothetical protein [Lachnospiraceae bacterium]